MGFKLSNDKTDNYLVVHAEGKWTIENANRLIDYVAESAKVKKRTRVLLDICEVSPH